MKVGSLVSNRDGDIGIVTKVGKDWCSRPTDFYVFMYKQKYYVWCTIEDLEVISNVEKEK